MRFAFTLICMSIACLSLSACGTKIFNADYDTEDEGGWPDLHPPGSPTDDFTTVADDANLSAGDNNIIVTGDLDFAFGPVGGTGKSLTFWPPELGEPNAIVDIVSAEIEDPDASKTLAWVGKKHLNDNDFECTLAGYHNPLTRIPFFPIFKFGFYDAQIIVYDGTIMGIGAFAQRAEGQSAPEHKVFIVYRPEHDQYTLSIQQPGQAEIEITRPANPGYSQAARTSPRLALRCQQIGDAAPFISGPTYMIDKIIMRER